MVGYVTTIGMDNLALMSLRISKVLCLTQNVGFQSTNTGAFHWYLPVAEKAPRKGKCYNAGSSFTVMGKMSTQVLHLAVWSEIILETFSLMYGTGRIAFLSAFMQNYCVVTHCVMLLTVQHTFSYQNINRNFILCKIVTQLALLLIGLLSGYNFARCFLWVWNLVTHFESGRYDEGVWEQGIEENIWS